MYNFAQLYDRMQSDVNAAFSALGDLAQAPAALARGRPVDAPRECVSVSVLTRPEERFAATERLLDCALDGDGALIRGMAWIRLADAWRTEPSDVLRNATLDAVNKRYGPIFGDISNDENPDRIAHWWLETLALGIMTRRILAKQQKSTEL